MPPSDATLDVPPVEKVMQPAPRKSRLAAMNVIALLFTILTVISLD
jgi:hypothetical protein